MDETHGVPDANTEPDVVDRQTHIRTTFGPPRVSRLATPGPFPSFPHPNAPSSLVRTSAGSDSNMGEIDTYVE